MSAALRRAGAMVADTIGRAGARVGQERYRLVVERLQRHVSGDGFEIEGIQYWPEPCSVGLTPHGELTGRSAARMVNARDLTELRVLDLCCGVGIVGLTLLALVGAERRVVHMSFADINVFNLSSLRRTIEQNSSGRWGDVEVETYLTDGLSHVPQRHQFDLIVSNPPHFDAEGSSDVILQPGVLGTVDPGWRFHEDFYAMADEYLTDRGEVWFLENRAAHPEVKLAGLIAQNSALQLADSFDDEDDPRVFWMITRRIPVSKKDGSST